jgi:nucleoside-diphosphate-sugar epimerase
VTAGSQVLMTGADGFTGRYVRSALESAGHTVTGLTRQPTSGAGTVCVDLSSSEQLRQAIAAVRPEYVLHLAAIAFVNHADAEQLYRTNVMGTLNLLDALIEERAPVRKVLLASSANIYGNASVSPVSETCPPAPVNHYAMSKLAMEHLAFTRLDRLPIAIARPFNYTGIGQAEHFLIPKIVSHFCRGERTIRLGNLDVEREFNDVRMVARAYAALMDRLGAGEVVNICSGQGHRLSEILELLREISGRDIAVEVDPGLVRQNEVKRLVGDPGRLIQMVKDLQMPTLRETLSWMFNGRWEGCRS